MKKIVSILGLVMLLTGLSIAESFSQLSAGDIAIVQYNADAAPDNIKFVCLADIAAGEQIKFTDNGWFSSGSWRTGEGIHTYTVPGGGLSCGDVVYLDLSGPAVSTSGDQIIAYQNTADMIFGINNEGAAVWQADATSSNTSALPSGLTNGSTAVAITEIDNAIYTGSTTGTRAQLLSWICDNANWSGDNTLTQTFSGTFTVTDCSSGWVSAADGDWDTPATWTPVSVPTAGATVTINHTVSLASNKTNTGTITVSTTGAIQINGGGYIDGTDVVYAATGSTLIMNHNSGLYGISSGQAFWPGTNPPYNVTIQGTGIQLNGSAGAKTVAGTLAVSSQFDNTAAGGITANGTLQIEGGGYFTSNSPIYGASSLLKYNANSTYQRQLEWTQASGTLGTTSGYPNNIQLSNNTIMDYVNLGNTGDIGAEGNLTIDAGSALYMDYNNDDCAGSLIINGDVTVSGSMSLGFASGSDLKVGGDLTINAVANFYHKDRAVFFIKDGTQVVSANADLTLPYIVIGYGGGSGTTVQLNSTNLVASALNTGNAFSFINSTDVFDINGQTLTIGKTAVANTISGSGTFKGSTSSNLTLLGTGSIGIINFTTGSQNLGTLTMNRQAGTVGMVLGTPVTVNTSLVLTNGLIDLAANDMTIAASSGASANSFVIADVDNGGGSLKTPYSATGSFTFPIGDATTSADGAQYSPATINVTAGSFSSAWVGINVSDTKHGSNSAPTDFITRYWAVTSTGITSPTYNFTGTYLAADINGTETNSLAARYDGTYWSESSAIGSNTLTYNNLTTLPATNHNTAGCPVATPSIAISTAGIAAADVNQGTADHVIQEFELTVTVMDAELTGVTVTTGGTYVVGDLTASSFKLRYSTDGTLDGGDATLSTKAIVASGNNIAFTGLSQTITAGTTGYLFVTTDIDAAATVGNNINITTTAFTNITFTAGNKTGTDPVAAGGAQTIIVPSSICGSESMANIPTGSSTSYLDRSWTGDDGVTWTATAARTDETMTGKSICFKVGDVTSPTYADGMGTLTFDYVRAFTGTGSRTLQVWVNGGQIGADITVSPTSDVVQTYSEPINIAGNIDLSIKGTTSNQVKVDNISWTCYTTCTAPSTQASGISFSNITSSSIQVDWTSGDGDNTMVVVHEGSVIDADPENGTAYTDDSNFIGSPDEIGTDNFVVYNGSGNSVTVTGLTQNTSYYFAIYEYNNSGVCYNDAEHTGNTATICGTPENVTGEASVPSDSKIDLSWTLPGCYDEVVVIAKEAGSPTSTLTGDGSLYTESATFAGGSSGNNLNANEYCVYIGAGTGVSVTGLTNGTSYCFDIHTRLGTTWTTTPVEICNTPNENVPTTLYPGDMVIVGFDTHIGDYDSDANVGDDLITVTNLVALGTGTKFILANLVYDYDAAADATTGNWFACSTTKSTSDPDYLEITYTGASPLTAGSILCIYLAAVGNDCLIEIKVNGTTSSDFSDNADGMVNMSSTSPDAVFLMQGTFSTVQTNGYGKYRTFNGSVLGGIQSRGSWKPITVAGNSGATTDIQERVSRVHPDILCMLQEFSAGSSWWIAEYNSFELHVGSQHELLYQIFDVGGTWNEEEGSNTASEITICSDNFTVTSPFVRGQWVGTHDEDWFDCANWDDFTVPDENTDVIIPSDTPNSNCDVDAGSSNAADFEFVAKCNNITLSGSSGTKKLTIEADPDNILEVYGDLTITGNGVLDMDDLNTSNDDGTLKLYGDWDNQVGNAAFSEGEGTISFIGTAQQNITTADAGNVENFGYITLDNSNGLLINDDIEIEQQLSFTTGVITTGANKVFISNNSTSAITGGATSGADNYIEGRLQWNTTTGAYTFPLGYNGYGAQGFDFTVNTGGGYILSYLEANDVTLVKDYAYCDLEAAPGSGSNLNVSEGDAGYDGIEDQVNFNVASPLQWNITNPAGGGSVSLYDLTVYGNGAQDPNGITSANVLEIEYLMKNGEPGNPGVATGTPGLFTQEGFIMCPTSKTLSSLTSFSKFTSHAAEQEFTLLPVELIYFEATMENCMVKVNWSTVSETNNDYFTVEKSQDGRNFNKLRTVNGAGYSSEIISYTISDKDPYVGTSYYRLKQTDFNGDFSYTNTVSIDNNCNNNTMTFYHDEINRIIYLTCSSDYPTVLNIYSVDGKIINSMTLNSEVRSTTLSLDQFHLSRGLYFVSYGNQSYLETKKIIIR